MRQTPSPQTYTYNVADTHFGNKLTITGATTYKHIRRLFGK